MNVNKPQIPNSVSFNAYKAYVCGNEIQKQLKNKLSAIDIHWNISEPKSLRLFVLDTLIENWSENPIISEITKEEDRIYMYDNIDVTLPIKVLSAHIQNNAFWKRCFTHRWTNYFPIVGNKSWISLYMEKHLQEMLENLEPCDYDQENMQTTLDICAPYVVDMEINFLQPSMGECTDHIPFDFILTNLPELRTFKIAYSTKTIGTNFYLGCSNLSRNDITFLCNGLNKCYDLVEFSLHDTKLEPYMMPLLVKALDRGCSNLESLSITHCKFGHQGLVKFVVLLNIESFINLRKIVLVNNLLSKESILIISKVIRKRQIEHLDLRLNPIGSEGASALFWTMPKIPIKVLNLSACSITHTIGVLLLKTIIENKTLEDLDLSNNDLGNDLGKNIYQIIGFNRTLRRLDLRNTDVSSDIKNKINAVVFENNIRI